MEMNLFNNMDEKVQPVLPMVVSFELPKDFQGKDVKLLHYTSDGVEIIDVEKNGKVGSAVVTGFSTFALVATDASTAPKTSDINVPQTDAAAGVAVLGTTESTSVLPWICLVVAALAGGAAVITGASILSRKKDEE